MRKNFCVYEQKNIRVDEPKVVLFATILYIIGQLFLHIVGSRCEIFLSYSTRHLMQNINLTTRIKLLNIAVLTMYPTSYTVRGGGGGKPKEI